MKKNIFSALLILLFINISAQSKVTISGNVSDEKTKEEVASASIRILNQKDSSYVAGNATGVDGNFSISINKGRYILHVSYMGYTDVYKSVIARESVDIGTILLKENSILLDEAVITAKAVEIRVNQDTTEYNADSYKTQPSAVLEDLVKKMPGAEVDSEGKITINGKEIKKILVDGKEFFSNDPKVASKNLPASMIEKLQVFERKSDMTQMTGFDDGNEETVINLTVKPGMKQGFFGNAFAGYGSDNRYEANTMLNYMQNSNQISFVGGANNTNNAGFTDFASSLTGDNRPRRRMRFGGNNGITDALNGGVNFSLLLSPKLTWGGNVNYGSSDNEITSNSLTQYLSTKQIESKNSFGKNESDNVNVNFRMEWTPDSLTKVIFTPSFQYNKNINQQNDDFLTTEENRTDSVKWGESKFWAKGNGITTSGTLDVSRQLGKTGRILSFSLSGGLNNSDNEGTNWSNNYRFEGANKVPFNPIDQTFTQDNKGYNWRGYVSLVEPLGNNNFVQAAYSFRQNHSESDKKTYNQLLGGSLDEQYTRRLVNDFTNQNIEVNFKSIRPKYNYTVGFAVQPSNMESKTFIVDSLTPVVSNNVVNFAPVLQFNYMWDKRSNLRLDYSGSTNQPTTAQLSSDRTTTDASNITIGNPNLKPSFSNRLRIQFRKSNPANASFMALFGGFNYTLNDIVNSITNDDSLRRVRTYENVNGNFNGNLRFMMNRPLKNKKFSLRSMTFASYAQSKSYSDGIVSTLKNLSLGQGGGLSYRSDIFDAEAMGRVSYNSLNNDLVKDKNENTFTYNATFSTTVYLPYNFTLESDMNFNTNSGYSDGFKQEEWVWGASLAKHFMKNKQATLRIKMYDILNQKSNISRESADDYISDVSSNTLQRYFMVHFIYKFQIFKNGAKAPEQDGMSHGRFGGGRPNHFL